MRFGEAGYSALRSGTPPGGRCSERNGLYRPGSVVLRWVERIKIMRATLLGFITVIAALGLLVGAVLLVIAARIALAAVLFVLFAAVAVWSVFRYLRTRANNRSV